MLRFDPQTCTRAHTAKFLVKLLVHGTSKGQVECFRSCGKNWIRRCSPRALRQWQSCEFPFSATLASTVIILLAALEEGSCCVPPSLAGTFWVQA